MTPRLPKKARFLVPALLVLGWLVLFRPASLGGPAGYVMVTGVSMEPTIDDGDFVLTQAQDRYEIGDVVAFKASNSVVIHRIIGGSAEAGFVMQGDNNNSVDSWRPTTEDVVGKRWLRIPGLGGKVQQLRGNPAALGGVSGVLFALAALGPAKPRRSAAGAGDITL
jgi:signal peptidase I